MSRTPIVRLLLLTLFCTTALSTGWAQDCSPPLVRANARIYNIFSPEQEMILGELSFQRASAEWHVVRNPQLATYLNSIGEKLIKHLPSTGLKFQFVIVDIPGANAYNGPGGYVLISRKLIASVNNEDELAGVMAHELGHAVAHHAASETSILLKKILNVTQVGDRKDINDKYNLLLERERTKDVSSGPGHESAEQLEADQIGLFAMTAAGYDPDAFATFFDRLVETKGETGSWFSDIFGSGNPEKKRLREMIKLAQNAPAQCRENRRASASQEFLKWQAHVVSYREANIQEELPGLLWKKELAPKLRSDISHFAFSQDGSHLLAQDDFAITVVQREPLQVLFQIPIAKAEDASFTPDGQFVVFGTENLRFEKWSVAEKKPVEIRELAVRDDCWEHEFSSDGKYLACVDYALGVNVLDTQSSKKVWEKKDFYRLSFFEYWGWSFEPRGSDDEGSTRRLFNIEFSPDSRYLAVSRSNSGRVAFSFDGDLSGDTLLGLDLSSLKPINVGDGLKRVTRRPFLFLDSNRIIAMAPQKLEDGGIFSFPDGKRLARFPILAKEVERTANQNYIIIKPLANAKLGIFDLTRNEVINGLDNIDVALWQNLIVYESVAGQLLISEVAYDDTIKSLKEKHLGSVEIPVGTFGRPSTADISDNLEWLAVSSKTRGAIWSLGTGERKMYLRGFRGALVANSGNSIGDFPKYELVNHTLVILKPQTNEAVNLREVPPKGAKQYRRFLLSRQSLKAEDQKAKESTDKEKRPDTEADAEKTLTREVRFELYDLISNKTVWSAEFPKEAPRFFFDGFSGRLILYWTLNNDAAKARLKETPALAARAKEMGNKDDDYLVEVVDAYLGKPVGTLLIETGKGSFYFDYGFSEGDWLVLRDSENRVLAYSIKDGDLRHRFFGSYAAINPAKNQIVVENYPGELTLYNLSSGDNQTRLTFPGTAAFVRFSLDGKKLFVLSGEQIAYMFDVEKLTPKVAQTKD